MSDRFSYPTFLWGLILALFGTAFVTEALGVWRVEDVDLGVAGAWALVVVGVLLIGGTAIEGLRRA